MELLHRGSATSSQAKQDAGSATLPRPPARPSVQQRLEASVAGRRVLSVLLVATLVAVALWNLPDSALRAETLPTIQPYVNTVGLDQRWDLFAPDPPRRSSQVIARIEYADGSLNLWEAPRTDRWRKWMTILITRGDQGAWERTAAWIAAHHDSGGRRVVRVELVQRWQDLQPPGTGQVVAPQQQAVFYTYDVPGGLGPGAR